MRWQYQGKAEPVLVVAAAEDVTVDKWLPCLPPPVCPRRTTPAHYSGVVEPTLFTAPPALAWAADYPDRISPRTRRPLGVGLSTVEPSLFVAPPALSWLPSYPDRINPRTRRPLGTGLSTVEPTLFTAAPPLSWAADYPDRINPPARRPLGVGITVVEPSLFTAPPALSWQAELPDRMPSPPRRKQGDGVTEIDPSLFVVVTLPDLSWQGEKPDGVLPSVRRQQPTGGVVPLPVTPSDWLTQHPGPVARRRTTPGGVTMPPAPERSLDWLMQQPGPVLRRPRRTDYEVGPLEPSLTQAPPALSWRPLLPDGPLRARRPRPIGTGVTQLDPDDFVNFTLTYYLLTGSASRSAARIGGASTSAADGTASRSAALTGSASREEG